MKFLKPLLLPVLLLACTGVHAGGMALTQKDCLDILERWAADPTSVPQHLVDNCKDVLAASGIDPASLPGVLGAQLVKPAAGQPVDADGVPTLATADPCAGAGAGSSVQCWGPWAAILTPAAGGAGLSNPNKLNIVRPIAEDYRKTGVPLNGGNGDLPGCTPGTACGITTVVAGIRGKGEAEDTTITTYDIAQDGTRFTVAPGQAGEINSVDNMVTDFTDRADGYENLQSTGSTTDADSRVVARVSRDNNDNIVLAADYWLHKDGPTADGNSGFMAWGIATSQASLDRLNNAGTSSVSFTGPMLVDNSTTATINIDFGTNPVWRGNWDNPGYSFGAGGSLSGVDLRSDPSQFTANVNPLESGQSSKVTGFLLGEGAQAVNHAIEVNISGVGDIKDTGLLLKQ